MHKNFLLPLLAIAFCENPERRYLLKTALQPLVQITKFLGGEPRQCRLRRTNESHLTSDVFRVSFVALDLENPSNVYDSVFLVLNE